MPHVVVAGAGIIGLATAAELLARGWDVTVCDPAPASGASHAAAGMLAPAAEMVWGQNALYPLMIASGQMYPEFLARLAGATSPSSTPSEYDDAAAIRSTGLGTELGHVRNGTIVVGADAADRAALSDLTAIQRAAGLPVEAATTRQLRKLEPALSPAISGGVLLPEDHHVDPRRLTAALLKHVESHPNAALIRAAVTELTGAASADSAPANSDAASTRGTNGVVLSDGRHIAADQVVLATGLAARELADLALRPIHGDILRLRLPASNYPLITRTVRALVNGRPVYAVPRGDSIVLGASSREDSGTGVRTESVHELLDSAHRILPGVLDSTLEEATARARPGTPDDVPLIGRRNPGLVVSTGYSRHGILLAPLGARLTADLVAGVAPSQVIQRSQASQNSQEPGHDDAAPGTVLPLPAGTDTAAFLAAVDPDRFPSTVTARSTP